MEGACFSGGKGTVAVAYRAAPEAMRAFSTGTSRTGLCGLGMDERKPKGRRKIRVKKY